MKFISYLCRAAVFDLAYCLVSVKTEDTPRMFRDIFVRCSIVGETCTPLGVVIVASLEKKMRSIEITGLACANPCMTIFNLILTLRSQL